MFGSSPLVVWLKPYMLPEILGVEVPDQQMAHRPATYTNYADHMKEVGDNKTKDTDTTRRDYKAYGHIKRPGGRRKAQKMDAESCGVSEGAGGEGEGSIDIAVDVNSVEAIASGDAASAGTAQGDSGDMESESPVNQLS